MLSSTQEVFLERVVASVMVSVDPVGALDGCVEEVVAWLGVVGGGSSGVVVSRGAVVGAAVGSGVVGGVIEGVVITKASVVMATSVVERVVVVVGVEVEVVYVYASESFIV